MTRRLTRFWNGRTFRRFRSDRVAVTALGFVLFLALVAVLGNLLAPQDPNAQDLMQRYSLPSRSHWLGTDNLGRDELSRLVSATRISLQAAALATGIAMLLGIPLGLISGYFGGALDAVLARIVDGVLSIPGLLLAFGVIGALGPGLTNAMAAIGFVLSPSFFRIARGSALSIRNESYIEAARAVGCTQSWILLRHLLPNAAAPLTVQAAFVSGVAIVAEASLSFLGVGVQPPQASWGSMVADIYASPGPTPYPLVPPAFMICAAVLGLSLLGDGLRDAIGRESRVSVKEMAAA